MSFSRIPKRPLLLFLVFWGLLLIRLSAPWYGMQDAFRVWIPSAVRNYEIYGIDQIGLMVTRNSEPVADVSELHFYSHHPALLAWLPALLTQFTGYNEASIRFVFASAMMIALAGFYVFVRRLYGRQMAFIAGCFFIITPMIVYFQRVPGHDPLGFMAFLLFGAVFVNWLRQPTRGRYVGLIGLCWLAVWSAWPAVIMVAAVSATALVLGRASQRLAVVGLGLVAVTAFAALMLFYQAQWAGSINSLLNAFIWRSSSATELAGSASFTMAEFFGMMISHLLFYATPSLVILAVWGTRAALTKAGRSGMVFFLVLFLGALAYQLAFRNASYIHDYYKAFFMPALAIGGAAGWHYVRPGLRRSVLRPVMDGLALMTVVVSLGLLFVMHSTGNQPSISAIIAYIRAEAGPDEPVIVYAGHGNYDINSGYDRVIMFYTFRRIEWELDPAEAIALAEEQGVVMRYIYCARDVLSAIPAELAGQRYSMVHPDTCVAFILDPSGEIVVKAG